MSLEELREQAWTAYMNATRTGDRQVIADAYSVYRQCSIAAAVAGAYVAPTFEIDWTNPTRGRR